MSSLSPQYLESIRCTYGLEVFIETGCYLGDGIAAALAAGFGCIRSCDIDERRVEHCLSRFGNDPRVQIVLGDSLTALEAILGEELGPALFWLDGHYPAFYGLDDLENSSTRFPVPQELELIHRLRQGACWDVILADDIRVVNAPDNPRWRPGEVSDYYRIDGLSIAELCAAFADTHGMAVDPQQEGVLTLTPKVWQTE